MFTTRAGGVSTAPWDDLNLALHVGDDPRHVRANRDLLAAQLGTARVTFPNQVHGSRVMVIDASWQVPEDLAVVDAPGADAIVTTRRDFAIGVLVADCIPVLLADADARVGAVAHVGRRGLAAGVLQSTVAAMVACGARPGAVVAAIGPGICGGCYEVPVEMRDEIESVVPGTAATTRTGTPSLDLTGGAAQVLRVSGIEDVRATGVCTFEDPRFYSYRRDGVTGRFAGVVVLAAGQP